MATPRVIITVAGGVVQSITADDHIQVWIVDWDAIEVGEEAGEAYVGVEPELVARQWGVIGVRDEEGRVVESE